MFPHGALQGIPGGDHAEMGKGLREVAQEITAHRIDFFRQQPKDVGTVTHPVKSIARFVSPPLQDKVFDHPEAAKHEGAFTTAKTVRGFVMKISIDQAITGAEDFINRLHRTHCLLYTSPSPRDR